MSADETLRELKEVEAEIKIVNKKRIEICNQLQNLKARAEKLQTKYDTIRSKEASNVNWGEKECEWHAEIIGILKNTFKLKKFRHKQLAAINAFLSGKDVVLLMPTGGGKSLCYQLPAMLTKGITLVISPLLSLIDDQIMSLKNLGINAMALNSTNSKEDGKKVFDALANGTNSLKLLYVTPEWMAKSKRFMSNLQKCYARKGLDRIAVDEVHCCSQWGHDFRPDYKFLGILKNIFPDVSLIGLTATATDAVILDCQQMLEIQGCVVIKDSYNRPNLYYEVKQKPINHEKCVDLLADMLLNKYKGQSGIIYTTTINDSVDLAKDLKARGVSIACYHATLDSELRQKIHAKWVSNYYQAVVATLAFGMGIDKPDVRFVIHHCLPKSMENFYQETGRAGRDDQRADCILLYSFKDVFRISSMVCTSRKGHENLYKLVEYCIDVQTCRRSIIASNFEDVWQSNDCKKMCDHCLKSCYSKTVDITKYCKELWTIIDNSGKEDTKLTPIKLLDAWFKTGPKVARVSQIERPNISREFGESILIFLLIKKYLKEDIHFTPYSNIMYLVKGPKTDCDETILMPVARTTPPPSEIVSNGNRPSTSSLKRKESESKSSENSVKQKRN